MVKIKNANACYTGGGVYAYIAELENDNFFMAADDWEGGIEINCKIDFDSEVWFEEWIDKHSVGEFLGIESIHAIIKWILANKPKGNYLSTELYERLERR